jgi:hypothetical protein
LPLASIARTLRALEKSCAFRHGSRMRGLPRHSEQNLHQCRMIGAELGEIEAFNRASEFALAAAAPVAKQALALKRPCMRPNGNGARPG